ncbi:MAG: hypothetical protein GX664_00335 [Bacteroidales bacterium]|nr:hypothetical protein [Bacteroidales bacterium]
MKLASTDEIVTSLAQVSNMRFNGNSLMLQTISYLPPTLLLNGTSITISSDSTTRISAKKDCTLVFYISMSALNSCSSRIASRS